MPVKQCIDAGDPSKLEALLLHNPELANTKVIWGPEKRNKTDPLHYVSDSVAQGLLSNGAEATIAETLITHGALINGEQHAETPLIGATSLAAAAVAEVLIDHGADIHATSVHGATALHWSCYCGLPAIAQKLLNAGAHLDQKCTQFHATPLFWAVHAVHYGSDQDHSKMVRAVEVLLDAGAEKETVNFEDYSALQLAKDTGNKDLITLLQE